MEVVRVTSASTATVPGSKVLLNTVPVLILATTVQGLVQCKYWMYSARESSSRNTVHYSAREQSSTNAGQKAQECQGHGNSSIRLHLVPTLLCTCGNPIVVWLSSSGKVLGNSMFNTMYWVHKMICNVYLRISLFYCNKLPSLNYLNFCLARSVRSSLRYIM